MFRSLKKRSFEIPEGPTASLDNSMMARHATLKATYTIVTTISLALILSVAPFSFGTSTAVAQTVSQSSFQIGGNDMSLATTSIDTDFASVSANSNSISNINLCGKIASSVFNFTNGNLTMLLLGNWSLSTDPSNGTSFSSTFTMHHLENSSSDSETTFKIEDLKVTSFQKINDNSILSGTTKVLSYGPSAEEAIGNDTNHSWNNVKTTISVIENKTVLITFDKSETNLNEIFDSQPIIGMVYP
jgi:hypothetical protein